MRYATGVGYADGTAHTYDKPRRTRAGVGGTQARRWSCPTPRASRSWRETRISTHVQRSAAAGERRLGVVHLRTCWNNRKVGSMAKRAMYARHTSSQHGGTGPHPQNPSGLGGEMVHFQTHQGVADNGALLTGTPLGVVLRNGRQAAPRAHPDGSVHSSVGGAGIITADDGGDARRSAGHTAQRAGARGLCSRRPPNWIGSEPASNDKMGSANGGEARGRCWHGARKESIGSVATRLICSPGGIRIGAVQLEQRSGSCLSHE